MTLKLNGSTDGSVSIDAPADTSPTGTDITLTLPTTVGSANQFVKNGGTAGELEYSSMVETSDGDIGIGTSSPSRDFHNANGICLTTGTAPQYRLNGTASDGDDDDRAILGLATADDHFFSTAVAGDAVLRTTNSGNLLFGAGTTERMRLQSGGTLLVGKTAANSTGAGVEIRTGTLGQLIIGKTFSGTVNGIYFNHNSSYVGGLNYTNTATSLVTSSDYRLKENVVAVPNAITRAKQLNPVQFNFIAEPEETVEGFIAHELGQVVPEACFGEKDAVNEDGSVKPQSIAQEKIIPLLTAALQEAISKIETLETKVAALEAAE